jgi:hypothetical protein
MAEHEEIGKVRKAAVDSNTAVTVAVLTNTTDLERGDLLVMERGVVKQNPPPWSLPSNHSTEYIECLECWGIGAACRPFATFDLEVEVSTGSESDFIDIRDAVENDYDDEAMHDDDALLDLHCAWLRRRRHPEKKVEEMDCDDEVLQMNADLSSWWRCDRGAEDQTEEDPEEQDDEQKGKEDKQGVRIAPPKLCRFRATLDSYDYVSFKECARHPPIEWCNPHWKQHAATLKYYEWAQQNAYGNDPEEDLLLSDRGSEVPTYVQTKSGSCRWNNVNTCFWCWQKMVTQIDDQIIRDGLTDMEFVFKGQVIEHCTVGAAGGFFLYRDRGTTVRLVPNFHKNQIWASEYNCRGVEMKGSARMMQFDLNKTEQ